MMETENDQGESLGNIARDLNLALDLLCGVLVADGRGVLYRRYCEPGDKLDIEGRRAIARVLRRGPVPAMLMRALANLFDPDGPPKIDKKTTMFGVDDGTVWSVMSRHMAADRIITFAFRDKHRRSDRLARVAIAEHIFFWVRNGLSVTDAVEKACERFNLQRRQVMKIWSRYSSNPELLRLDRFAELGWAHHPDQDRKWDLEHDSE